ncbi:TrbC/VirB2 family protein [Burkholderia vietnamiensis]|uniref:TrbC/VirB2 family protein n=1 Tax=Burkholderia vietnamiensis TaxID=60552 RepID=UPI001594CAD4|nr:TrbC/VirB2 family protein [Burkholderia vietnamiensis]
MTRIKAIARGAISRFRATHAALAVGIVTASSAAHASSPNSGGSGMPWEGPLNTILTSLQGPVARFGIIAAIIFTGIMMAFGEHGSGFKKVMGIAFGGSIVVGAVSFISTLFGAAF